MLSRIKFDIDELVYDILNQLPEETWKSTTTTFLDPAIGGGQFIRAIEQRLRAAGHSDENISGRVYGCESSKLSVQYARNKYKLVATLSVGDFLKTDFGNMIFDNVVGNPPFQKTFEGERKAKRYNLWSEFVTKAMTLSDRICFVVPDGWMSSGTEIFNSMKSFGIRSANIEDCGKYFSGVAVRFTSVDLERGYTGNTSITNLGKTFDINLGTMEVITPQPVTWSILQKMTDSSKKMGWRRGRGYHTSSDMNVLGETGKYEVVHTNAQTFYTDEFRGDQGKIKVIGTLSGWFKPRYDVTGNLGACQATAVLETKYPEQARAVFESRLFRVFFDNIAKQQGWINLTVLKMMNDVDFSKKWTDKKLYSHFKLTKEEIDYVETNVK